MRDMMLMVK